MILMNLAVTMLLFQSSGLGVLESRWRMNLPGMLSVNEGSCSVRDPPAVLWRTLEG